MMWLTCRGPGIYLAFQSSARCATRSTSGAYLPPGRCTASGQTAGTRTTGGLLARLSHHERGPAACGANGPEGTARPVPMPLMTTTWPGAANLPTSGSGPSCAHPIQSYGGVLSQFGSGPTAGLNQPWGPGGVLDSLAAGRI